MPRVIARREMVGVTFSGGHIAVVVEIGTPFPIADPNENWRYPVPSWRAMKTSILIVTVTLLVSCATHPVSLRKSTEVQASRILATPTNAVNSLDEGGKIIVIRDAGMAGAAVLLRISVDGTPVAKLNRYERYEVILGEGEHILGVFPEPNFFGMNSIQEATVNVTKGQIYHFRVGFNQGATIIQRTTTFRD